MKTLFTMLFFTLSVLVANAQKSKFVEISTTLNNYNKPKLQFNALQIGLPSFSAAASVGRKMSINKHLTFSYQFGVIANQVKSILTESKSVTNTNSDILVSAATKLQIALDKKNEFFVGMQVNKSAFEFKNSKYNFTNIEGEQIAAKNNSGFSILNTQKYNANVMLGFTHNMKAFNNKLSYSIQYNLGFAPYYSNILNQNNFNKTLYQGVQIGLIYNY